jgi:cell wall assembly regulator SMI1
LLYGKGAIVATRKSLTAPIVKASWARIETWFQANVPSYAKELGKPASEKDIARLQERMSVRFPKPFIDSCMIHVGQKLEWDFIPDGCGTLYLMQLKDIPVEWKMLNHLKRSGDFNDFDAEADSGVANQWWSDEWIPFAANGGGDLLCLDRKPAKGGNKWQVVKFVHDEAARQLVAPVSFQEGTPCR